MFNSIKQLATSKNSKKNIVPNLGGAWSISPGIGVQIFHIFGTTTSSSWILLMVNYATFGFTPCFPTFQNQEKHILPNHRSSWLQVTTFKLCQLWMASMTISLVNAWNELNGIPTPSHLEPTFHRKRTSWIHGTVLLKEKGGKCHKMALEIYPKKIDPPPALWLNVRYSWLSSLSPNICFGSYLPHSLQFFRDEHPPSCRGDLRFSSMSSGFWRESQLSCIKET